MPAVGWKTSPTRTAPSTGARSAASAFDRLRLMNVVKTAQLRRLAVQREREGVGRRLVPEPLVLEEAVDRVETEAVDAAAAPEAEGVVHRRHDLGVAPVEVRLLRIERVQIPAAALPVAAPGGAAERRRPVVRRPVGRRPDVPVRVLAEPRVLDRPVAGDEVEQHAQPERVRGVAEVGERRGVDRREPEGVDAEPGEVVEPRGDPAQVADAVAVRVLEGTRVNLVDDRVPPPALGRALQRSTRGGAPNACSTSGTSPRKFSSSASRQRSVTAVPLSVCGVPRSFSPAR